MPSSQDLGEENPIIADFAKHFFREIVSHLPPNKIPQHLLIRSWISVSTVQRSTSIASFPRTWNVPTFSNNQCEAFDKISVWLRKKKEPVDHIGDGGAVFKTGVVVGGGENFARVVGEVDEFGGCDNGVGGVEVADWDSGSREDFYVDLFVDFSG
jgi:hypothetical protein